jgi:hypothetical protein
MCLPQQSSKMSPQNITMQNEEVEDHSFFHHVEEVYWDVPMDDLAYLGIFPEGHHLEPLVDPVEPWLPDEEAFCFITPVCEETEN